MPIFRGTLVYYEQNSGMSWTLTNHRNEADAAAFKAAADSFNTAYMAVCAESVKVQGLRVSNVDVYRDMIFTPQTLFTTKEGQIAGDPTEIASCAVVRCYGSAANAGSSMWRLHGISDTLVTGSQIDPAVGVWTDINIAAGAYFRQYRPTATLHVPVVTPPVPFVDNIVYPTLYVRRLGRPITLAGQQRAYLRTA